MSWIAVGVSVAGTVMSAQGQAEAGDAAQAQGEARKVASDYSAAQLRVNAGQAEAQGQIASLEEIRKSKLIQSRALALAAASGGGTDGNVIKIISGIAGEGELARLTQIYNGDERARGMRNQANATAFEGEQHKLAGINAKRASDFAVTSTILSGAAKAFGSMGGGDTGGKLVDSGWEGWDP